MRAGRWHLLPRAGLCGSEAVVSLVGTVLVMANRGGHVPALTRDTIIIALLIVAFTLGCVLIFMYLRRSYGRPKPVVDQWQALAVMGELCPHGWQAHINLYGWGAPVPDDAPPSRVPLVELEWERFEEESGEIVATRRVWAPTIREALQTMVEDRRTDITLEGIEQATGRPERKRGRESSARRAVPGSAGSCAALTRPPRLCDVVQRRCRSRQGLAPGGSVPRRCQRTRADRSGSKRGVMMSYLRRLCGWQLPLWAVAAIAVCGASASTAAAALPGFVGPMPQSFGSKLKASTLETVGGLKITCTGGTDSGQLTGPKALTDTIRFTGCILNGLICTNGRVAGEIETFPLNGTLGYINKAKKQVGLDLAQPAGLAFMSFECAEDLRVVVKGSVIGKITPINRKSRTTETSDGQIHADDRGAGTHEIRSRSGRRARNLADGRPGRTDGADDQRPAVVLDAAGGGRLQRRPVRETGFGGSRIDRRAPRGARRTSGPASAPSAAQMASLSGSGGREV